VRYRRTKLGLSQAQLGDLVGRSASTVKSWERDASVPTDSDVVNTLSTVLDFDVRALFDKAGLETPEEIEIEDPTVEQALASLAPEESVKPLIVVPDQEVEVAIDEEPDEEETVLEDQPDLESVGPIEPIYTYSTEALLTTTQTQAQPQVEPSYLEDRSQRQFYRVRNLATIVILVALGVVILWSYTNAFDAFSAWWDDFWGSLRL
jgi:transcriptional regulator with XRE-family HTH domain